MGLGTNIILVIACIAFMLYLGGQSAGYNGLLTDVQQWASSSNGILTGIGLTVAIFGTFIFPNPYTIFLAAAVTFFGITGLFAVVLGSIGMPTELVTFFQIILNGIFLIADIAWLKGGGEL